MLANKWLFFNMISILILSIVGTLIYSASIGFTMSTLSDSNFLNLDLYKEQLASAVVELNNQSMTNHQTSTSLPKSSLITSLKITTISQSSITTIGALGLESAISNNEPTMTTSLTLIDWLLFGTILSSTDSTTMLNCLRLHQANEKLYYMVLGENLMNNAVVLVLFEILLEFLSETRLTVLRIYTAILQFFITLLGAVLMGIGLALVALISIRIIKRVQVVSLLASSYQKQCKAMVETLLILKLAFLSYTMAALAGISTILSLATFGLLQDQYIKGNLSLRSQFTLRQVTFASKTLGYSLVYPLIGMLMVEVAYSSHSIYTIDPNTNPQQHIQIKTMTELLHHKDQHLHLMRQFNLYANLKLLSLITIIAMVYKFILVIVLSQINNLLSSRQHGIRLKEQILLAYGGIKGPLALALVHRLIEHHEYRDSRTTGNKHLFIYIILVITFLSNLIRAPFIRPLVIRMQLSLCSSPASLSASNSWIVFNEFSCVLMDHTTHGLNSILGRKKSFYDRFVEFNQNHIKPFLAGNVTNTNSLIVFHDNLILEETMNANCFHRSVQESARVLANKNTTHPDGTELFERATNTLGKSVMIIGRLGKKFSTPNSVEPLNQNHNLTTNPTTQTKHVSRIPEPVGSTVPLNRRQSFTKPGEACPPGGGRNPIKFDENNIRATESALLKEIVLFNLKKDESGADRRTRRQQVDLEAGLKDDNDDGDKRCQKLFSSGDTTNTRTSSQVARDQLEKESYLSALHKHMAQQRHSQQIIENNHHKNSTRPGMGTTSINNVDVNRSEQQRVISRRYRRHQANRTHKKDT